MFAEYEKWLAAFGVSSVTELHYGISARWDSCDGSLRPVPFAIEARSRRGELISYVRDGVDVSEVKSVNVQRGVFIVCDAGGAAARVSRHIVMSLALRHPLSTVRFLYMTRYGSGFDNTQQLPHVINFEEKFSLEEKTRFLHLTALRRKIALAGSDSQSIEDHNVKHPNDRIPYIVVIADDAGRSDSSIDVDLLSMLKCANVGFHFITASHKGNMHAWKELGDGDKIYISERSPFQTGYEPDGTYLERGDALMVTSDNSPQRIKLFPRSSVAYEQLLESVIAAARARQELSVSSVS